jgi:hypothetical protein
MSQTATVEVIIMSVVIVVVGVHIGVRVSLLALLRSLLRALFRLKARSPLCVLQAIVSKIRRSEVGTRWPVDGYSLLVPSLVCR